MKSFASFYPLYTLSHLSVSTVCLIFLSLFSAPTVHLLCLSAFIFLALSVCSVCWLLSFSPVCLLYLHSPPLIATAARATSAVSSNSDRQKWEPHQQFRGNCKKRQHSEKRAHLERNVTTHVFPLCLFCISLLSLSFVIVQYVSKSRPLSVSSVIFCLSPLLFSLYDFPRIMVLPRGLEPSSFLVRCCVMVPSKDLEPF